MEDDKSANSINGSKSIATNEVQGIIGEEKPFRKSKRVLTSAERSPTQVVAVQLFNLRLQRQSEGFTSAASTSITWSVSLH